MQDGNLKNKTMTPDDKLLLALFIAIEILIIVCYIVRFFRWLTFWRFQNYTIMEYLFFSDPTAEALSMGALIFNILVVVLFTTIFIYTKLL